MYAGNVALPEIIVKSLGITSDQVPLASIPGGVRKAIAPNKNIPGREYLFAPSKF